METFSIPSCILKSDLCRRLPTLTTPGISTAEPGKNRRKIRRKNFWNITSSGLDAVPLLYLFDTPDAQAEKEAVALLQGLTGDDASALMYESKATVREKFQGFQDMFVLLGGLLCAIIGLVGILNFFNAVMTGILSRQREFAVLQSIGMTGRQLNAMLVYEGLFYALGAALTALVLSVILTPLIGNLLEDIFWFFSFRFRILPVLAAFPAFALLGWLLPALTCRQAKKFSIVERLRSTD